MKYFATFLVEPLEEFDLPMDPMDVLLVSKPEQDEEAFREIVLEEIGNSWAIFPLEEGDDELEKCGVIKMTIDELKEYRAWKQ